MTWALEIQKKLLPVFEFYLFNVCQSQEEIARFRNFFDAIDFSLNQYQKDFYVSYEPANESLFTPFMECLGFREKWMVHRSMVDDEQTRLRIVGAKYSLL